MTFFRITVNDWWLTLNVGGGLVKMIAVSTHDALDPAPPTLHETCQEEDVGQARIHRHGLVILHQVLLGPVVRDAPVVGDSHSDPQMRIWMGIPEL